VVCHLANVKSLEHSVLNLTLNNLRHNVNRSLKCSTVIVRGVQSRAPERAEAWGSVLLNSKKQDAEQSTTPRNELLADKACNQ
jgi:hypothetical protein